jgi:DNA-binding transcriptional LysR family regulator
MDRLESMSILLKTSEMGSLSAVSRQLGMPLATVSRKITELETHLGTRLLNRSTRRLSLTDAGRSYVIACKNILEKVEEAERSASGEYSAPKGDLSIAAPFVFGRLHVLPIVTEFLKIYPDINLRFSLQDRTIMNFTEDNIDAAVRIGALPDSSLISTRVGQVRLLTCASPAYLAARGTPKIPKELSSHDCVTFEQLSSPKIWTFTNGKSAMSVPVHSRLVVTTAEAAIDAASAGIGITRILSYQIANRPADELNVILKEFEPEPLPVSVVHAGGHILPQKLRAFLDFATPRLRARLDSDAGRT